MKTFDQILKHKIVAIIRGAESGDVPSIAEALLDGGIVAMEVTLNSPEALSVIEKLTKKMGDKMLIGAGTVLNKKAAKRAIAAGARFLISPIVDQAIIEFTKKHGIVSIPGAYTPTEIAHAYSCGGNLIKIFPASGNVNYIKEVRAPLPHIPLMPTGGINLENILEFQKTGAVAFGIGTALVDTKQKITNEYLQQLTERAQKFIQAVV